MGPFRLDSGGIERFFHRHNAPRFASHGAARQGGTRLVSVRIERSRDAHRRARPRGVSTSLDTNGIWRFLLLQMAAQPVEHGAVPLDAVDRKSTRLNSSH